MTRSSRVTLPIAVAVLTLFQAPTLLSADEGCSDLYNVLRRATGDTLVKAVRGGNLGCLNDLRFVSDPPLQIAVSRESNLITVANSIPDAMADYTGSENDGVEQLFVYLRAAEWIHFYCLDRSCDGEEWNSAETYSMEAGSPVHRAVKAAIDSFVEHPLFRHASSQHVDTLHEVGHTIINYEMSGLYLSLVENWLNDWDDNYAANPIFHDQMREMLDIVSFGHVRPPFGDFFGEYRGLVHAFRDFVFAERWLGSSSQWIMERSAMELVRYFWHKDTTNYDYVLPIVLSALTTYRNRSEAKEIYLRLVGEIYANDGDKCERYDLCDWWAGEGFNANFRAAVFTDTMECPLNACSGETITMHAQDLEADKLATACQRMYEEGQAFQALFGTQCTPVPGDVNNHVDVYVFNDGDDCWQLQWPSFYSDWTCSGIHFEHDPSDPDTSVQLVVTEYTPNEEAPDLELPIVNFEHEYAHHLDARFNLHGPYLVDYDSAHWWIEGFAEYFSAEVSPYIGVPPCETPYSLTETLLHSLSIPTTYPQRHLAARFLMENHRDFIDRLLEYTRRGEYAAYTAHLAAEAPKLEEEWQAWLALCDIGSDFRVRPYCYSAPDSYLQYGYIARVVLGSLDHTSDDNRGHRFYDDTVTVQAGSTVELRVTASVRDPVEGDVNRVEAWIDWDGDGRFDGRTEQVMYREVQLTNPDHPVTVSENVRVPADAHVGTVRLRVRVQHKTSRGQGVCENYESGETQDYNITVKADPNAGGGNGGGEDFRVDPYCHTVPEYYQFGYLSRVALGSLNHAGDDNLGHRFYDDTVTVQAGSTVNLSVTASQQIPVEGDVNRVEAWIDWGGDGQFYGTTEQVMYREVELTNPDHPVTVSERVRVPADAHVGTVRLRVRVQYKTSSGQGVCENYESGETQDYDITVTADPNDDRGGYDVVFVPVLLTSAGHNNAFFTSELTLTNRGDREAVLGLTYMAHRGGGSGSAKDRLAPGQQTIHPNAIDYLTGLGIPIPSSGNRLGTLRVEVSGSSDVGVSMRTTTSVPEGRAGLAYPGISEDEGFQEAVYLCGLRQNAQDRSNLAFQHMGTEGEITLRTTVFSGDARDRDGRMLGDRTLKPGEFHQYNEVLKALGSPAQGYVKVEKVDGEAPFYAYGVINDNFNSDGSFVFPITESTLVRTMGQTLPVIVETGSFQSELTVTNFSASEKQIAFRFVAVAVETSDDTATFSLTLKVGEQRIVPQIVSWLRRQGVTGIGPAGAAFIGALFATPADGDMNGIVIGARTGSPDERGGQYSLFYNAVPYGSASVESAWIYGLQQNGENRSNLALVNTGEIDDSSSTFEITIYDGSGKSQPRMKTVTLGPRRWSQENGILGIIRQGYVRVRKTSGNNPFVTYGVINDGGRPGERSGDGAFLLSQE